MGPQCTIYKHKMVALVRGAPLHHGKVFKIKRKCHSNKHYIKKKLKLKIVQFVNKFSFDTKQINNLVKLICVR